MATTTTPNGNGHALTIPQPATTDATIDIDRIAEETLHVPILGVSPLIVHRFSEKEKRKILDKTQGRSAPKEAKNPKAEYEAAFYRLDEDDGYGMPADAFKKATVGAARFYGKAVTMTALKQFIFIRGERGSDGRALVRIHGEPQMREDVIRVSGGGADLRYRPEFREWTATLVVTYFTNVIKRDSVLSLIDAGGLAVGVGEWRPEKSGTFGTYRIDPDRQVEVQ